MQESLRAVKFQTTLSGDMMITLIYGSAIDPTAWREAGAVFLQKLVGIPPGTKLLGRSKGILSTVDGDTSVQEILRLRDGRALYYRQPEGSFSNPNGRVNERCLDWLCARIVDIGRVGQPVRALLELYCGCGNHTMARHPARYHAF